MAKFTVYRAYKNQDKDKKWACKDKYEFLEGIYDTNDNLVL